MDIREGQRLSNTLDCFIQNAHSRRTASQDCSFKYVARCGTNSAVETPPMLGRLIPIMPPITSWVLFYDTVSLRLLFQVCIFGEGNCLWTAPYRMYIHEGQRLSNTLDISLLNVHLRRTASQDSSFEYVCWDIRYIQVGQQATCAGMTIFSASQGVSHRCHNMLEWVTCEQCRYAFETVHDLRYQAPEAFQ